MNQMFIKAIFLVMATIFTVLLFGSTESLKGFFFAFDMFAIGIYWGIRIGEAGKP